MLQNSRYFVLSRASLIKMKIACLPQVGQQNTRKASEVYANCKHITGYRSWPPQRIWKYTQCSFGLGWFHFQMALV